MDRNEAILRELNLYPQWVRRDKPVPEEVQQAERVMKEEAGRSGGGEADTQRSAVNIVALNPSCVSSPSKEEKEIASFDWAQLKEAVHDCSACRLRAGCTQTVFGVGDEKADWLFVGEGPGADEDVLGQPFVGQAGKLLDSMLAAIKLKRGKNVYIANIIKCRPPGNRTPAADEIAQCLPYLQRQIELLQPKLIVALGKVASNALLGQEATLASLRNVQHDYHVTTATGLDGIHGGENSHPSSIPHQTTASHRVKTTIPLIVTYHPAYLLRSPTEKAKAWEDLCFALQVMATSGSSA